MKVCCQTGYRTQDPWLTSQVPYRLRYAARPTNSVIVKKVVVELWNKVPENNISCLRNRMNFYLIWDKWHSGPTTVTTQGLNESPNFRFLQRLSIIFGFRWDRPWSLASCRDFCPRKMASCRDCPCDSASCWESWQEAKSHRQSLQEAISQAQ